MTHDSIVEEIHRVREEIAARHKGDLKSITDAARARQKESGRVAVAYPAKPATPRPPLPTKRAS